MDPTKIRGVWYGDLRGTLAGNLFAEFIEHGDISKLLLRANYAGHLIVLAGDLRSTGEMSAAADLSEIDVPSTVSTPTSMKIEIEFIDQQALRGRWEMPDGNAGVFTLIPSISPQSAAPENATAQGEAPIQVVQRTGQLPKLSIFRDELNDLVKSMKAWLPSPFDVVIRADIDGKEVRRMAAHFWLLPNLPQSTERLNLWLSEPGDGAVRSININLSRNDCSYTVTGADDIWVSGTFQEIDHVLGRKNGRWQILYQKHALNLNGIAMLLALVLLPSLELIPRFILLSSTVIFVLLIKQFHDMTTAVKVNLKTDFRPTKYVEPSKVITTIASAALIAFVGWAFTVLNDGGLGYWIEWLINRPEWK
ncbi:hypothetical protein [Kordiimonas sp.]|uniref:hypothetical protein n=1 Tax=Kordiimonas sp. TaxID=1970157 RepID=UPI003A91C670